MSSAATARANQGIGSDEVAVLADFSQAFATTLDVTQTVRQAVEQIAAHMNAEAAALFLIDGPKGELVCRACFGPVDVTGLRVPQGRGIVGRSIKQNKVQLVQNVETDADHAGDVGGFVTRSILCAPLTTGEGAIGALQVLNKRGGELFNSHDRDILRLLAVPTTLALSNARLAEDLMEQERIRREFQLARQMQKDLLPRREKDCPVVGINMPAREISGDFYDHFQLADGRIAFCVGDVSGKGMDAALLMVRASSLLRWAGKEGTPPDLWLKRVNDEICTTVTGGRFVCVLAGYYDPVSGMLEWSNGGLPPLLLRHPGGQYRQVIADGPPLGIVPGIAYPSNRAFLGNGSAYIYSDGATDVRGEKGEPIGIEGFQSLIDGLVDLSPRARLRGLVSQLRHMKLADDTTLMLVEDLSTQAHYLGGISIHCDAECLRLVRKTVDKQLRELAVPVEVRQRLVLAIDEATANVIRHAYKGDPGGRMSLDIWRRGEALEFVLRDWAEAINKEAIKPRDLSHCRPGGLGVNLIDMVMDSWGFEQPESGNGNVLRMIKHLEFRPESNLN
ncbi:MAG: SpoIIE family protein phosphatase [Xanthomonadales bacterium]|nr:SpoIIE family protein phosphatase [Xanthomonadales bacterium]